MFCRVTYVQAPEGRVDEGLQLWYDNVLPVTKAREGFKGVLSLVDKGAGKALSVTFWEGEEARLASTEAEYHQQAIERFGEFFENAHDPDNMELHLYDGEIFSGSYYVDEAGRRVVE